MQKIFYVQGYDSWAGAEFLRAFDTLKLANAAAIGLTDAKIHMFKGKTKLEAANKILMTLQDRKAA